MTEQQLADMIVDDLTEAQIEVIGVSCPCPSDEIEDAYNMVVGRMNEKRYKTDMFMFGFDLKDIDPTKTDFSLISVLCSNNQYIRILIWNIYRSSWAKSKFGETIDEIIMDVLLSIGYVKGFISLMSRMCSRRYSYREEFIDDITRRFIVLNKCNALRNVLYMDWILLCNEFETEVNKSMFNSHIPNMFTMNMDLLRYVQRNSFDTYLQLCNCNQHNGNECKAILLRWKHEVLDNDDSVEEMEL